MAHDSEEQIIGDPEARRGRTNDADLCRHHGISEPTYHNPKAKYRGMDSGDAKNLKQLEDENRKLKHVVADLTLENRALKDVLLLSKNLVAAAGLREAVSYSEIEYRICERRLQAAGVGTIDTPIPEAQTEKTPPFERAEEYGQAAHAIQLWAFYGDIGARRNGRQRQAGLLAVPRGRNCDEDWAEPADPLE
ncbi:MAG: transposase [Candidatus Sulfotelmatobacter sp.]|jgi:putative transposase